jgi:acyl-homoserine lactone acylase PvdQ
MVDDIDLFAEKINPENENQYFLMVGGRIWL